MNIDEMKITLKNSINNKRYNHCINVMNTAVQLASQYGQDKEKAAIAGLLHDCARDIKGDEVFALCEKFNIEINYLTQYQPDLLHGPIGANIAREVYGVKDELVFSAISCHTTGRENMNMMDKIVFIADYIEPNRNFPCINDVRKIVYEDIDSALILALDRTIKYVMSKGALIHPDTIGARNSIIFSQKTR